MKQHIHEELEQEVRFISGNYTFIEEECLQYNGRDVFFLVGVALLDNTCCGAGGCRFIRVPGYVVVWKGKTDESGLSVSEIEPIADENEQSEVKKLLDYRYPYSQIYFDNP